MKKYYSMHHQANGYQVNLVEQEVSIPTLYIMRLLIFGLKRYFHIKNLSERWNISQNIETIPTSLP